MSQSFPQTSGPDDVKRQGLRYSRVLLMSVLLCFFTMFFGVTNVSVAASASVAVIVVFLSLFTRSFKERFLWWVMIAPLSGTGFFLSGLFVSAQDILSLVLIFEFFIKFCLHKLDFPAYDKYVIYGIFFLVLSFFYSLCYSPHVGVNFGPFARYCVLGMCFVIGYLLFPPNDAIWLMKAIGVQVAVFLLFVLSSFLWQGEIGLLAWLGLAGDNARLNFSNVLTYIMLISFPFFQMFRFASHKTLYFCVVLFCLFLSLISLSRAAFIIIIVDLLVLAYFLFERNKKYMSVAIVSSIFVVGSSFLYINQSLIAPGRSSSNTERLNAAKANITAFTVYPLTGTGFGEWIKLHELNLSEDNVSFESNSYRAQVSLNPHNTLIRVASDTGIIGLIAFFTLLSRTMFPVFFRKGFSSDFRDLPLMLLKVSLLNQLLYFAFGDYLESTTFITLLLTAAVFAKYPNFERALDDTSPVGGAKLGLLESSAGQVWK